MEALLTRVLAPWWILSASVKLQCLRNVIHDYRGSSEGHIGASLSHSAAQTPLGHREFSSQFKDAYDSMGKKFHPHGMLRIFVGMSEQYPSAWLCFDTANRETRPIWHCRFVENMHVS